MSLDADLIVDRRRMRRKLTFWRVVTVLVAIVAVVGAGVVFTGRRGAVSGGPGGTASRGSTIDGLIRGNRSASRRSSGWRKSNAKAVIVHIDSPGGTMAGSEQLYDSLMRLEGQEADGGGGRRARGLRRLYRRDARPTTSWRSRPRSSARSASCSSIPTSPSF